MKNRQHKTTITIERDGVEFDVIVAFDYYPAHPGFRDKYGAPEEPDEPEQFDFVSATLNDGTEIELLDSEIEAATEQVSESMRDNEIAAREAKWDERREEF